MTSTPHLKRKFRGPWKHVISSYDSLLKHVLIVIVICGTAYRRRPGRLAMSRTFNIIRYRCQSSVIRIKLHQSLTRPFRDIVNPSSSFSRLIFFHLDIIVLCLSADNCLFS